MENLRGRGRPFTGLGLQAAVTAMGLDPASDLPRLWAVLTVESRGFGFQPDRRPKLLFERHVFSRETDRRFDKRAPDLSNSEAGGYIGGAAEYERLDRAVALLADAGQAPEAALRSASWGLGQVMGFNHETAGFPSAAAMVAAILDEEDEHLMAMAGFVRAHKLGPKLKAGDWEAVAKTYNGKNFAEHGYHIKLRQAFEKFSSGVSRDLPIRRAQAALLYLGFGKTMGDVDGVLGDNTRRAIRAWRLHAGLPDSDRLDGGDFDLLMAAAGL
ncbi:N-acetylmuramidase domain-containing protein [Roseomonas pecuniae]|uniref:N-acetylmuramidase domain-containing protein n=1 Tax=Roseomonas populi TaxID=3121582 RepID=A0ABT1X613_9PROT|nr:N-acetylmuramidase domain-containing protein [Roseomonas pecuniae]